MNRLLTIGEAADMLGVSVGGLRKWADEGRVPFMRLPGTGSHRRWTYEQINQIKADMAKQPSQPVAV
jgi:excisionase family DNA binding protein